MQEVNKNPSRWLFAVLLTALALPIGFIVGPLLLSESKNCASVKEVLDAGFRNPNIFCVRGNVVRRSAAPVSAWFYISDARVEDFSRWPKRVKQQNSVKVIPCPKSIRSGDEVELMVQFDHRKRELKLGSFHPILER